MSLVHPLRAFPPKPHASTHLAGGSDQLFDQNLNTTNTVKFAGVQLGSYVLDTLLANNKVPYAGSADSASKLVASGYTLDTLLADDKVPYAGSADSASKLVASGYTLDTLVANNKVPDSDKWDGTHRTDSQTIGGNITIGGDLQVNGNDIKDSGGSVRITLGDPVVFGASVKGNSTGGALRIKTDYGYVDIGAMNASWVHLYTDRPRFYFDKGITVNTGNIGSYDEDLYLQRAGTTKIQVTTAKTIIVDDLQVNGNDILDSGGTTRITLGAPTKVNADLQVNGANIKDSDGSNRIVFDSGGTYIRDQNGSNGFVVTAAPLVNFISSVRPNTDNKYYLGTSIYRWSSFYAVSKSAAFPLVEENFAYVMHCVEAPKFYLIDVGHGQIGADGKAKVVFREEMAVLMSDVLPYYVFIQPYNGSVKLINKDRFWFEVSGEPNTEFDWMVVAVRVGDEDIGGKEELPPPDDTPEYTEWWQSQTEIDKSRENVRQSKIRQRLKEYRESVATSYYM